MALDNVTVSADCLTITLKDSIFSDFVAGTYTSAVVTAKASSTADAVTFTLIVGDITNVDEFIINAANYGSTLPTGLYLFTVTPNVAADAESDCAIVDCALECDTHSLAVDHKDELARVTFAIAMYEALQLIRTCDTCTCADGQCLYEDLRLEITSLNLLTDADCGCS